MARYPRNHCTILLIFTAFFSCASLCVFAQEDNLPEIPAPENSQLITKGTVPLVGKKILTEVYLTQMSRQAAAQFYLSYLRRQGYALVWDKGGTDELIRKIKFKKDDFAVSIAFFSNRYGTNININRYIEPQGAPDFEEYPLGELQQRAFSPKPEGEGPVPPQFQGLFQKTSLEDLDERLTKFEVLPPPQTSLVDSQPIILLGRKMDTKSYRSQLEEKAVADYYLAFFKRQGFVKADDQKLDELHLRKMRFKRADFVVDLVLNGMPEGTNISLSKYLQPKGTPDIEEDPAARKQLLAFPKEDAPGQDLPDIPRPPESVRTGQTNNPGEINITYTTALAAGQLRDFYLSKMARGGWQVIENVDIGQKRQEIQKMTKKELPKTPEIFPGIENLDTVLGDSYLLSFQGAAGENAEITILPNFVDRKLGTIVYITRKERR